jgi:hypothetical protein
MVWKLGGGGGWEVAGGGRGRHFDSPSFETFLDITEQKDVKWCEIRPVEWMESEPQSIFFTKGSTF